MKQLFSCYLKSTATFTMSLFMLLFVATKTNAQWIELSGTTGSPFGGIILSIATDASKNVYAGGLFNYVGKWNGTRWSKLGNGNDSFFSGTVWSIATDASGNVYAGGGFYDANGNPYVAKWNGTEWSELGGVNGSSFTNKYHNAIIYSIATDASGNVYAGGGVQDANSKFYVAKWNGTAWSKLGGINDTTISNSLINSIATDAKGNVYAGGVHDAYYNEYVVKWNGTEWSKLIGANGSPFNKRAIQTVATDAGGNVYAGGQFVDADSNFYVAKWNGTEWSELGGTNGTPFISNHTSENTIESITTDARGNVYAAGVFTVGIGDVYVYKWNGTEWSELGGANGTPFHGFIASVATDAGGNVYAGGNPYDSTLHTYVAEYALNILPVTLVSFTATKENKDVVINWQTANEINTSYFIIQRSTDGVSFTNIGKVAAENLGNEQNTYSFTDEISLIKADKIYYRLQIADNDGKIAYSSIASVNNNTESYFTVFPNPARNILNVSIKGSGASVAINIFDVKGVKLKSLTTFEGHITRVIVNDLTSGIYILQAFDGKKTQITRFIKQ